MLKLSRLGSLAMSGKSKSGEGGRVGLSRSTPLSKPFEGRKKFWTGAICTSIGEQPMGGGRDLDFVSFELSDSARATRFSYLILAASGGVREISELAPAENDANQDPPARVPPSPLNCPQTMSTQ